MARYTKDRRQKIIRDFCLHRNADFDARLFEQEVRETGPDHPAYEWFEWDGDKAAREHRIWQAREFAKGLRVSFTVEEIGRSGAITVRQMDAPMLVSPLQGRHSGGGYQLVDPDDPEHMAELCRQAAADLGRWLRRYEGALAYAGGSTAAIATQVARLEAIALEKETELA